MADKYKLGDTIKFNIETKNTGNIPISEIVINNSKNIGSLEPDSNSNFFVNHTVTLNDIKVGSVEQYGKVTACDFEGRDDYKLSEFCIDGYAKANNIDIFNPHITITVSASNPANGNNYALGEEIIFTITITNDGNVDFTHIEINGGEYSIDNFKVGDTVTYTVVHRVTEEDIILGHIDYTASLTNYTFTSDVPWDESFCDDATLSLTNIETPNPRIVLSVTASNPANGSKYAIGENIVFSVTARNTGNINFSKIVISNTNTRNTFNINDTYSYNVTHTITKEDMNRGYVDYRATLTSYTFKTPFSWTRSFCNDAYLKLTNIQQIVPKIVTNVTVTSTKPANGYSTGDTINFKVEVSNPSNSIPFTDVVICDTLNMGTNHSYPTLGVNTSKSYTINYVVTEDDIIDGYIEVEGIVKSFGLGSSQFTLDDVIIEQNKCIVDSDLASAIQNVTLTISNVANKIFADDALTYTVTATNTGNVSLKNVDVYSATTLNLISNCTENANISNKLGTYNFNVGQSKDINVSYTVPFYATKATFGANAKIKTKTINAQNTVARDIYDKLVFTVDTRKLDSTNKITGIPVTLFGQDSSISLEVNWGDNKTETLTPSSWTDWKTEKNIHTYATAGAYSITITGKVEHWNKFYVDTAFGSTNDVSCNTDTSTRYTKNLYYFKKILTKLDSQFPAILGVYRFSTNTSTYTSNTYKVFSKYFKKVFSNSTNLTSIAKNFFRKLKYSNIPEINGCFYNCTSLTSLPSGLFMNCTELESFQECFYGCSSLTSIPQDLFKYSTKAIDFSACFTGCTALASIPQDLFKYNTNVIYFGGKNYKTGCFDSCSSLTSIPEKLFDSCVSVKEFDSCFRNCTSLRTIPQDLFKYNVKVITFEYCFQDCTSLTSIPSGLFDNCPAVEDFESCFYGCSSLTSIPSGLFDNCPAVKNFESCFSHCTSIITIPAHLFDNNTEIYYFSGCFSFCKSLTSIPTDLFKYNTKVAYVCSTDESDDKKLFYNCSSLTTVPAHLFDKFTEITCLKNCFSQCTSLQTLPTELFRYNTEVTTFEGCFEGCYSLRSIPSDLFKYNIKVKNFSHCFSLYDAHEKYLTAIPNGLFDTCVEAETFSYCFRGHTKLVTIPQYLFRYNIKATNFAHCFAGFNDYMSLANIPQNLFRYNVNATTFDECFRRCNITTLPTDLFRYNVNAISFDHCFDGCSVLQSIPIDLFRYNVNATDFNGCFVFCASLTEIPRDLFRYNVKAITFGNDILSGCFRCCRLLTVIPTDLFRYNVNATSFVSCFSECDSLNNFTIRIGSTKVTTVTKFVTKKTDTTRTVRVPTGSTTKTTFSNVASSLGLTIQEI